MTVSQANRPGSTPAKFMPQPGRLASLTPNGIQAILFDLDGTLRHNRPNTEAAFLDYATSLGAIDTEQGRQAAYRWAHYYWAQSPEMLKDEEAFADSEEAFWVHYAQCKLSVFGCTDEQAQAWAPLVTAYMKDQHRPEDWVEPDVPATLTALKEAGFRLGVLSNRNKPCHEQLENLALSEYFDLVMVAGEVASWKPEPKIFEHALQRLDVSAGQTVYVGDNYYADVVGSKNAGLHPVLLDPDGIFPEADCPVIQSMSGLLDVLQNHPGGIVQGS